MKKILLLILIGVLMFPQALIYVHAADSTFQTNLTITPEDLLAPSVPTGLTASAISFSQINLSWNASTDDVGVSGYRIFRDSLVIATTTSLFYSDTGLTASTTYDYTVEAFDGIPRFSGQSATSSATTLDTPVTPTPGTDGGGSGSAVLRISDLKIDSSETSSVISFLTNQPTRTKIYWGITKDHELGTISSLFHSYEHAVRIDDLRPSTNYFFKIEAANGLGITVIAEGSFQTQKSPDELALTNPSQFKAIPQEKSIALTWKNPQNDAFDSVRIVRSDKFFPRDIYDGETIYEGESESYVDANVAIGKTYYYALFAKGTDGSYSSGVLAQARIVPKGEIVISPTSTDPFINIPVLQNVHPVIAKLTLADFDFIQSGRLLSHVGQSIAIDGSKNLTISLAYDKVPEVLKTIAITLFDPDDPSQVFPFLLRVNKEKTAYEAVLAPLGKSGKYKMGIIVLDYKNQGLKKLEGSLKAFVFEAGSRLIPDKQSSRILYIIVLIIVLLILMFLARRKKKAKNESQ